MRHGHFAHASAKGSDLAFLDQRLPAYEREIINMVGMGVTENPALRPHVKAGASGFSITYVRAAKGKGAALHRHATEEVFLPIHGRWQVFWLEGDIERQHSVNTAAALFRRLDRRRRSSGGPLFRDGLL